MYAIVDIETTGGSFSSGKITEIAILIHDGKEIVKQFHTLINPFCRIPFRITQLTGITNEIVLDAPAFYEIAKDVVEITKDMVFVAHNAGFDYGFVKAAFKDLGYEYHRKTLCTVKLARASFPGLSSYNLDRICDSCDIEIDNRHRALGDAMATAALFSKIIIVNPEAVFSGLFPAAIKKSALPPLLNASVFENIPGQVTGVYYFYNSKRDVIYVGKSKDIKKRLLQHFSANRGRKRIRMLQEIADVSYENTGNELVALLLESFEIKSIKPKYNVSQKRTNVIPYFGIFQKRDRKGYLNLYIKRLRNGEEPIIATETITGAEEILNRVLEKYNLCLSKCDMQKMTGACFNYHLHKCHGACAGKETTQSYNLRVKLAIKSFSFENENFFIVGDGRNKTEKSLICIENGKYRGFGFIDFSFGPPNVEDMRDCIRKYLHNKNIQQILGSFLKKDHIKIPFASDQVELFREEHYE